MGHPYSALNLRLVLASFGLVTSVVLAVVLWRIGLTFVAVLMGIVALTAVVDLVVIQLRRRQRRREEQDGHHSLFE